MSTLALRVAAEAVERHTQRAHADACWSWTGSADERGRARVWHEGAWIRVTRFLLGLTDPEMVARHTCDNPACVNPGHLVPGTQLDNMADMRERKRALRGRHDRKVRPEDHAEIHARRAAGETVRAVGDRFGVAHVTILRIERHCASGCIWDAAAIASVYELAGADS